jgi:hypothetical protein
MLWLFILVCLILSTSLLYHYLSWCQFQHEVNQQMEDKTAEARKLVANYEKELQSGMWIKCPIHGDLPLTKVEYDKQTMSGTYGCPLCKQIPRRIWKR